MDAMADILAAVQSSKKLDETAKTFIAGFLEAGGGAVAGLAPTVVRDLMAALAGAGNDAATATLASQMSAAQLPDAITGAAQEMAALADERARQAAASRAVVAALGQAALSVLAKAVVAAL